MIIGDNSRTLVIAGTGHRPQKLNPKDPSDRAFGYSEEAQEALKETLRISLIEIQTENFDKELTVISGVAPGYDQALAEVALEEGMRVIAAVPFEGQEKTWRPDSQRMYSELLERIEAAGGEVHVVSEGGYSAAKMQARNEWMVDRADMVLALHRSGQPGGTRNCIEYAEKQSKEIVNIWDRYAANAERQAQRTAPQRETKVQAPDAERGTNSSIGRIDVVHVLRFKGPLDDSLIYIGREMPDHGLQASPLANPYHIGPDGTRPKVVEKYRTWLRAEFQNQDSPARAELLHIQTLVEASKDVSLGCWCSPQQCHGEVVRDAVTRLIERDRIRPQAERGASPERDSTHHVPAPPSPSSQQQHSNPSHQHGAHEQEEMVERVAVTTPRRGDGLSHQARAAHVDVKGYNQATDDFRALYEPQDGLTRAEHADKLNRTNVEARDAYERGASVTEGDVLVIPREFNSLPPEINITTQRHAVSVISAFTPNEAVAKEKAEELVTLAEQISGTFGNERSRIIIFHHLYSQFTQDEHGTNLPMEERPQALEKTLETAREWAREMKELEPVEVEEHSLDETAEREFEQTLSENDRLHDENEVYAELYTEATEHYAGEQLYAQEPDHLEVEARQPGALPQTLYERTSLRELPPMVPDEISLETRERIFNRTLPSVDRALESGTSREEIMRGIYSSIALRDRTDQAAKIGAIFAAASPENSGRDVQTTRETALSAYTTLKVLVSGALEKERARFTPHVLESSRRFYEQNPPSGTRSLSQNPAVSYSPAHPHTGLEAKELYTAHEKDIRLSRQNLLGLDHIPTRAALSRIEDLERALSTITASIERIAPEQTERIEALNEIEARASFVITTENRGLSNYEQAEKTTEQVRERLSRPLAFDSIRTHLTDELTESEREIETARNEILKATGFIPDNSAEARQSIQPFVSGMEKNLEIARGERESLGGAGSEERSGLKSVGPVFVSLAGHGNVRLPLDNAGEHSVLQKMAESYRLSVASYHGPHGGEITGHSEERTQIAHFISNYASYRLTNAETRLLNRSAEYRIYTERLGSVTTLEELRETSRAIRRENYSRSQQVQAHQREPENVPLPPSLDPTSKAAARPLTAYEMRQLFTQPAPEHYTDEMRAYRQGLSATGRDKQRLVEALTRGEFSPSQDLAALLNELDLRKTGPAISHYTRSILKPSDQMERPSSFDLHATYEKLLPYERDYLYAVVSDKKQALERERSAPEREHEPQRAEASARNAHAAERSALRELSQSPIFHQYYGTALWQEAQVFTTERTRREEGVVRNLSSRTICPGLDDRQIDAAAYLLKNFDARQTMDVADHLKESRDSKLQLTGEILQAFAGAREDRKEDGRTEITLQVPDNSRLSEREWRNLLDYLHPDDRSDNRFLKERLPESQLSEIRQEAQTFAWASLEQSLQLQSHDPDARAETLYKAQDVKATIDSAHALQEKARTAHHALEKHVEAIVMSIEPGNDGKESTLKDREVTSELVRSVLDPARAAANRELISQHADQHSRIQQNITPQQERDYTILKSYAAATKESYLKEFFNLDERSRDLNETRQADLQRREELAHPAAEHTNFTPESNSSRSQSEFRSEYEAARAHLTSERIEAMIKTGTLPERGEAGSSLTVIELLPEAERNKINNLAREAAWWSMVPAEVRGDNAGLDHTRGTMSPDLVNQALLTSEAVSQARSVDIELRQARESLASFIANHTGGDNAQTHADGQPASRGAGIELMLSEDARSSLGEEGRAEFERLAAEVNTHENRLAQAFSEIDSNHQVLDVARENQAQAERVERFNEVRSPLEARMKEYLSETLAIEGAETFHDSASAERHTERLAEAMRECVEDHGMTLSSLNLRSDDVQEIANNLVSSLANTFEHNHTISRDSVNSPDLNYDMAQQVEVLALSGHQVSQIQDQAFSPLSAHNNINERSTDHIENHARDHGDKQKAVDKEQTQGVGGMETIDISHEQRPADHLEHAHDLALVLTR